MPTKAKLGPGSMAIEGERYGTVTFEYDGDVYVMRELSIDESDDIWDASQKPDKTIDNRLNSRLLLSKALVQPSFTVDGISKFGSKKYVTFMRHFNELNTVPEANPTPPAGSAGPMLPSGGTESPAT